MLPSYFVERIAHHTSKMALDKKIIDNLESGKHETMLAQRRLISSSLALDECLQIQKDFISCNRAQE